MPTYGYLASAPIGPGLQAGNGGVTLTTTAAGLSLARAARSVFGVGSAAMAHGVGVTFWGDGDLVASFGLLQPSVSLSAEVGTTAGSIGWRLHTGEVRLAGSVVLSGLAVPVKGDIVSIHLYDPTGAPFLAEFWLNTTMLGSVELDVATWHYAISMGSDTLAGDLQCAINAGQWPGLTDHEILGWTQAPVPQAPLLIADAHYLTAVSDTPSNTRYEGIITSAGMETFAELGFWPWANQVAARSGTAQLTVNDPSGALDGVSIEGMPVRVRMVPQFGSLAAADDLARFVVDSMEVQSDGSRRLLLRDPHDALDEPVNRAVFLPSIPALAWQPQQMVIGAMCSVPFQGSNSDGTAGFLADSPIVEISAILDRGDALEEDTWSLTSDGQQVFLESPPQGPVVSDISTVGAGMQGATLPQALHQVFSRGGVAYWSEADALAIQVATGYRIGFYAGSQVTGRAARDQILANWCASSWSDESGVLRFVRLIAPEDAFATFAIAEVDMEGDLLVAPDEAPNLTRRMGFQPNAAPMQESDFVTDLVDVPLSRRQQLMEPHRGTAYTARALAARYAAADRRPAFVSGLYAEADAQAEIDRVSALYSVNRNFYTCKLKARDASAYPLGAVGTLTYPRYGLSAGRNLFLYGRRYNSATGDLVLKLWG